MLDLDPLFLKKTDVLAPSLSVVFLWLVRLGSFPACWRQASVTPIPKGPPSSSGMIGCISLSLSLALPTFFNNNNNNNNTNRLAYSPKWKKANKCTGGTITGPTHCPEALLIQR